MKTTEEQKYRRWKNTYNVKTDLSSGEQEWFYKMQRKYDPQPEKIKKTVKKVFKKSKPSRSYNMGRAILTRML